MTSASYTKPAQRQMELGDWTQEKIFFCFNSRKTQDNTTLEVTYIKIHKKFLLGSQTGFTLSHAPAFTSVLKAFITQVVKLLAFLFLFFFISQDWVLHFIYKLLYHIPPQITKHYTSTSVCPHLEGNYLYITIAFSKKQATTYNSFLYEFNRNYKSDCSELESHPTGRTRWNISV